MSGVTPDHSGFMKKKGGFPNPALQKRWFELVGPRLFYYKTQSQKAPTGVINLKKETKIDVHPTKANWLVISGKHLKRKYEMETESETVRDEWINAIKGVLDPTSQEITKNDVDSSSKTENFFEGQKQSKPLSLDDFDLLCVLGRGSFGKVMKVMKKDTKEVLAMKVLAKDMLAKNNMILYTKTEKEVLQEINHPFIVRLKYAFQNDSKLYFVLDFLSGGELFFHLSNEVRFSVNRTKFYAAELVLAIGHLHSMQIIYRDLKPENVVLDGDGHAVMTDFGLAKKEVTDEKPTQTFCGTPEYLAPEIVMGKGYSRSVDWWSLGILIYEMLVGLPPFYSENMNEMYDLILKAPLEFPNEIPSDAKSLCKGLLERNISKRLGCSEDDYEEIKAHPFFESIDWEKLYAKQITPPFVPKNSETNDKKAKYFDPEFTKEKVQDSFAVSVKKETNVSFEGFEYNSEDAQ